MSEDHVAMVSRNPDGSDAQPNATVRILDADASTEADDAQLDIITAPEPDSTPEVEDDSE